MKNEVQKPIMFKDENYMILFGKVEEYSMGGAYACPIYFAALDENIIKLHHMCADRPLFHYDYATFYFAIWYSDDVVRLKQCIAKFDIKTKKLSIYKRQFAIANITELHNGQIVVNDTDGKSIFFNPNTESILTDNYKTENL